MGGKSKRDRTKNNARPSSSGRSAELLFGKTKDPATFGIINSKPLTPIFPTLATVNLEQGLNSEYALCFKKFNKKDPITKTKALQELLALTKRSEPEEVVAALPAWAHYYPILSVDTDRKVRECTQGVQGAVAGRAGRQLAPQLRRLLPAWLLAACDEHGPARLLAHTALMSTFPGARLGEAVAFCGEEAVSALRDRALAADRAPHRTEEDEEERKAHSRFLAASGLGALALVCGALPASRLDWLWAALQPLLRARAFWSPPHAAHHRLRAAWYELVHSVWTRFGDRVDLDTSRRAWRALLAAPTAPSAPSAPAPPAPAAPPALSGDANTLAATHATDAVPALAAPPAPPAPDTEQRWAALLALAQHAQGWPDWADDKDISLLLKRLQELLQSGGWGSAARVGEVVRALVSRVPACARPPRCYLELCSAACAGLEKKSIFTSKSERRAWIESLCELLRHVAEHQPALAAHVVPAAHRACLARALAAPHPAARASLLRASALALLALDAHPALLPACWRNVITEPATQLAALATAGAPAAAFERLADDHVRLLAILNDPHAQDEPAGRGVRFAGDSDPEPPPMVAPATACDEAAADRRRRHLDEAVLQAVLQAAAQYLPLAVGDAPGAAGVLRPLRALLTEFESGALLISLADRLDASSLYDLYEAKLRPRLAEDDEHRPPLLDIVFLLLEHMSDEERDRVFQSFEELPQEALECCVARCLACRLAQPHPAVAAARRWLRGERVQRVLLALTARAFGSLAAPDDAAEQLLLQCVRPDAQGESISSEETIALMVEQVCAALPGDAPEAAARSVRTAAQLCTALSAARSASLSCARLAHALFALQLQAPAVETRQEACRAWQTALAALPPAAAAQLRASLLQLLHRRLAQRSENLDISEVENIANVAADMVLPNDETGAPAEITAPTEAAEPTEELLRLLVEPCDLRSDDSLEYCALKSDCIMGNINCPFDDDNGLVRKLIAESSEQRAELLHAAQAQLRARGSLFRVLLLRALQERASRGPALLQSDLFLQQVLAMLHDLAVLTTLEDAYVFSAAHDVLADTRQRLERLADHVLRGCGELRARLPHALDERAARLGYYWPHARRRALHALTSAPESTPATASPPPQHAHIDLDDFTQLVTGGGFFHTLQANSRRVCDGEEREDQKEEVGEERLRCLYLVAVRSALAALEDAAAAEQFAARAADGLRDFSLDPLLELHCTHPGILVTDREISGAGWAGAVSSAAVADLLAAAVNARGWQLAAHQWDFVTLTLAGLLHSLQLSAAAWGCNKVALVGVAALRLFARVQRFACGVRAESERRQPAAHVLALAAEWTDVFAPALNAHLFDLVLHVLGEGEGESEGEDEGSGSCVEDEFGVARAHMCRALSRAARSLQWDALPAEARAGRLGVAEVSRAAEQTLGAAAHPARLLLAYNVLRALGEPLVLADAALLAEWSAAEAGAGEGEGETGRARPALAGTQHDAPLRRLHRRLAAPLACLSVCGSGVLPPHSGEARAAAAFLLLHAALHERARLARGDLAVHYVDAFREGKFAEQLMETGLRLLPGPVAALAHDAAPPGPAALAELARHRPLFRDPPDPSLRELCSARGLGALACRGLTCALGGAGAPEARSWWGTLGAREARAVRRLVTTCVAPLLREEHLGELRARAHTLRDAEVAVLNDGSARCRLELDERTLELSVEFSEAHPLVPPRVSATAAAALLRPAAADAHWLTVYLAYQNGSLFNTFKMWVRAMNGRIESTRQCCVCYYRLHPATGRLPAALCPQCRNKFHGVCLRKWFKTHGAPTCPLCRSEF